MCTFNASKVTLIHFSFERQSTCSFCRKTDWINVKFLDGSVFLKPNPNQILIFCTSLLSTPLLRTLQHIVVALLSKVDCHRLVWLFWTTIFIPNYVVSTLSLVRTKCQQSWIQLLVTVDIFAKAKRVQLGRKWVTFAARMSPEMSFRHLVDFVELDFDLIASVYRALSRTCSNQEYLKLTDQTQHLVNSLCCA